MLAVMLVLFKFSIDTLAQHVAAIFKHRTSP